MILKPHKHIVKKTYRQISLMHIDAKILNRIWQIEVKKYIESNA